MQTKNKLLDDISQIMNSAMGVAQGARDEAQNAMRSMVDRMLADRNLVTREEFEAVRAMAQKAREENDALAARIATLEGLMRGAAPAATSGPSDAPTTPSL
jgi:BMFP domain-containing protein YqiC